MTETTEIYFSKSWRLEVLDQGLAVSVSSRNSFPGLPFHVSSHGLSSVCAHEREVSFSLPLLLRPLTLSDKGPTFITSINLNYPLKALSPNTVTLGVRASTQECGGGVDTPFRPQQPLCLATLWPGELWPVLPGGL